MHLYKTIKIKEKHIYYNIDFMRNVLLAIFCVFKMPLYIRIDMREFKLYFFTKFQIKSLHHFNDLKWSDTLEQTLLNP